MREEVANKSSDSSLALPDVIVKEKNRSTRFSLFFTLLDAERYQNQGELAKHNREKLAFTLG